MKLYSNNGRYVLYEGSMLDMSEYISDGSIDGIVTDPPYELNFMGKGWDRSGIAFQKETWKKCFDALKPGGYLLAFGGSRTFHRIACAIEDAGFEIRDTIMWLYGTGFPKSMNVANAIEGKLTNGSANKKDFKKLNGEHVESGNWGITKFAKDYGFRPTDYSADRHMMLKKAALTTERAKTYEGWGTALKPAYEPIIVARKPFGGSLADNVIKYGTGAINIDGCRIGTDVIKGGTTPDFRDVADKNPEGNKLSSGQVRNAKRVSLDDHVGRFPSNVILTYDENDENEVCGMMGKANRYFYCAKASTKDRDEGLETLEKKKPGELQGGREENSRGSMNERSDGSIHVNPYSGNGAPKSNFHPTVKPTSLMQYLIRLVIPKGGTVLDPFMGSGSTGKAAMLENSQRNSDYRFVGIELTGEYLPVCKARIDWAMKKKEEDTQLSLF